MFEELLEELRNCGLVKYEAGASFVRILPHTPVAFPVKIEWIWDNHFTVFLDGWRQDCDSYEEAVTCFARAASGGYRLKTGNKGGFRFRWTVEYWDGSGWAELSTNNRSPLSLLEAHSDELPAQRFALWRQRNRHGNASAEPASAS